jgi:hypothetical protein
MIIWGRMIESCVGEGVAFAPFSFRPPHCLRDPGNYPVINGGMVIACAKGLPMSKYLSWRPILGAAGMIIILWMLI